MKTETYVKKISNPEEFNISGQDFNEPAVLVWAEKVEDFNKLLYFIDFFRIELFDGLDTFNEFKRLILKYTADKRLLEKGWTGTSLGTNYGALMEKDPNPDDPDQSSGLLNFFAQLFYLIVEELQEKQDLVDFIYDAVRKEREILKFSNKNVLEVSTDEVYNSVFSSVYDYSYFTYFPLKLDAFYDVYIKKYPYFGTFHKPSNKLSSLFSKNKRIENKLNDIRLSKDLQNDFFDEKFLNLYIDLRLKEENKKASNQIRLLILTEVKEVYSKAFEFYKDTGSDYVDLRNICLKIVEGFIGSPYNKQKPVDAQPTKKTAAMMAHDIYFNKNLIEPRIQTDRLCCNLPELVDIIAEQDPCPDWFVEEPDVAKVSPQQTKPEPAPEPAAEPVKEEEAEIKSINPCCKYINKAVSPLLSSDGKPIITAHGYAKLYDDYPADIKGNFVDFPQADVLALKNLYDYTEGLGNEADQHDIIEALTLFKVQDGKKVSYAHFFTQETRCYLCRRQPQFLLSDDSMQSLLDFFEENLQDKTAALTLKVNLQCEEFGLATYRGKYSKLSCPTDGYGNCKGYENEAYGLAVKGACKPPMKVASEAELCEGAREILKVIMKLNKIDPPVYNGKNIIDMTCKEVAIAMNALQG